MTLTGEYNYEKKLLKKVTILSLAGMMLLGMSKAVNARTPLCYNFEVWNGSGDASVNIDMTNIQLKELTYEDNIIDSSNYIVEVQNNYTVITLKEAYLKSLGLGDGNYSIWGIFEPNGEINDCVNYALKAGNSVIRMERRSNSEVVKMAKEVAGGEEEISDSDYTVQATDNEIVIQFSDKYAQTLSGDNIFKIYLSGYMYTIMNFQMDSAVVTTALPEPSATENNGSLPVVSATPAADTKENTVTAPKTADTNRALPYVLSGLASATVLWNMRKYKNMISVREI